MIFRDRVPEHRLPALPTADRALAARLEAAEAANLLQMAEAARGCFSALATQAFGGGLAVFAAPNSPMSHAVGVGLRGAVAESEMEAMEQFFRVRGSACTIDLCPLAHPSVLAFLENRPYRAIEFNNVMIRPVRSGESFEPRAGLRRICENEADLWAEVICRGFSEYLPVTGEMTRLLATSCRTAQCWLAGSERPLAGAAMAVEDKIALFFGDATVAAARRSGWHTSLIGARLAAAREQGCELAMASVMPGSASHRNYERAGFQLVYMRVSLTRKFSEPD